MSKIASYRKELTEEVSKKLMSKLKVKNVNCLPKLKKIVLTVGIGSYMQKNKDYAKFIEDLSAITGQRPVVKKSKVAISNFKLRIGMPVGVMVTLRGSRMYAFVAKLVHVILPRVRDFRGLSKKAFDGMGNYTIGLSEYNVFPEVKQDDVNFSHGIQISFVTTAKKDEEGLMLLETMGLPFIKK